MEPSLNDTDRGVRCPRCSNAKSRVVDSRTSLNNRQRRRRQCCSCGMRFTTYEAVTNDVFTNSLKKQFHVTLDDISKLISLMDQNTKSLTDQKKIDIKNLREKAGLSIYDMAKKLSITKTYFSRMERGKAPLPESTAQKVLQIFKTHSNGPAGN